MFVTAVHRTIDARERGLQPTTIRLEPYLGTALTIWAEVNGHAGLFLFDTGEGVSTISSDFAKTIGCIPWGRITGFRMTGGRLDFPRCDNIQFKTAGETLTAPIAGRFDIMSLLPADAPHLDGSLGLDILAGRAITYDQSSGAHLRKCSEPEKANTKRERDPCSTGT
jgi:hypothetical protein